MIRFPVDNRLRVKGYEEPIQDHRPTRQGYEADFTPGLTLRARGQRLGKSTFVLMLFRLLSVRRTSVARAEMASGRGNLRSALYVAMSQEPSLSG